MSKEEELAKEQAFQNRKVGFWQMVGEAVFFFTACAIIILGLSVM